MQPFSENRAKCIRIYFQVQINSRVLAMPKPVT